MNEVVNIFQVIEIQNIQICKIDENDDDDINEKYINSDQCNELDVLATLVNNCETKTPKSLEKNKQIIQEQIEKEKQYSKLKIPCQRNYVNVLSKVNQLIQILHEKSRSQTIMEDEKAGLANKILMPDQLIRYTPTQKEKKLAKELKDQAVESSEKLLHLLMGQEIHEITMRDILGSFIAVHKMMFQNLPAELQQNVCTNKNPVEISSESIAQNNEKGETEKL